MRDIEGKFRGSHNGMTLSDLIFSFNGYYRYERKVSSEFLRLINATFEAQLQI